MINSTVSNKPTAYTAMNIMKMLIIFVLSVLMTEQFVLAGTTDTPTTVQELEKQAHELGINTRKIGKVGKSGDPQIGHLKYVMGLMLSIERVKRIKAREAEEAGLSPAEKLARKKERESGKNWSLSKPVSIQKD